ncbi:DUF6520 family protein [Myroides sp. LJL119]
MFKLIKKARLQIAVFVLAIGGAFATNAMSGNSLSQVDAYQRIDSQGFDCVVLEFTCDTDGNLPCTYVTDVGNESVYGLHEDPITQEIKCSLPLYEPRIDM